MPYPRNTLTQLRALAMQDVTASDLPNADGFLRYSVVRVLAWVVAGMAYLHDAYLDWISKQSTPFTSTGEFLDAWAALAPTPVLRQAPAFASGPATWPGTPGAPLPLGTVCNRADNFQYVTIAAGTVGLGGTVTVTVRAVTAGAAGNTDSGTPLTLATSVAQIVPGGSAAAAITGGADLEADGPLQNRMLESYAAPPHGGNSADYVTWTLQVPGVTRAWVPQVPLVPGAVSVFFMMDAAEAAHAGFPQGTNGVSAAETRDTAAAGDQLAVANYLHTRRPVTPIVYAIAPVASPVNFTLSGLTGTSIAQQAQIAVALAGLFLEKDSPLATTSIQLSDVAAAITAIGGLPPFAISVPASWPITAPLGYLFTLGTVTYV